MQFLNTTITVIAVMGKISLPKRREVGKLTEKSIVF
jgi:hypothetical protein